MKKVVLIVIALSIAAWATVGQHSILLSWSESDGTVVKYNIYRGNATGVCNGSPTPYATSTTKSYTDTAVVNGTTYVYAVSALNSAGGESACSAEAQVTVPSSPQPPTNLQITLQ